MHVMSNAVMSLREKRSSSGNNDTSEKSLKIGDLQTVDCAMKVQSAVKDFCESAVKDFCAICNYPTNHNHSEDHLISPRILPTMNGKATQFCSICICLTDHNHLKCPKRSTAFGLACSICYEPCDIKEHKGNWTFKIKWCLHCPVFGDHWTKDCPTPDDDDDMFF